MTLGTPHGPFQEGEVVLLVDFKGRRYTTWLVQGSTFYTHMGHIDHQAIIGVEEGSWIATSKGNLLLAFRPTLADFVLEMPRTRQVIYPKDLGGIIIYADIFPGARVLEAGLGSGALTLALLRAVGESGYVVTYELQESVAEKAMANLLSLISNTDALEVKIADLYEGIEESNLDRIILD